MTLHELRKLWNKLTVESRNEKLHIFFTELLRDPIQYEDFLFEIVQVGIDFEQDDYFGTEGVKL